MKLAAILALFCATGAAQGPAEPTPQPVATQEDLASGERMFRTQCAYCHGTRGEGGRGAALAKPQLHHAADDTALFQVIARGIPESEMPGHWFNAREIWQLVAFVRTLGQVPSEKPSGDPNGGEKLYADAGCAGCHTIDGRGGAIGPDLTGIGTRRSPAYLRESLLTPDAAVPAGFLLVRAATRDKRKIEGVRLNEDAFSIQMRDVGGNLHSFWKSELSTLEKASGKSPMPSYREKLTAAQIDDMVAYLVSIGGAR